MSKLAKSAIGLMMITILVKVLGFARELVLASSYGMSMYTDAYVTALNIPIVIVSFMGTALNTSFIPIYTSISNENNENKRMHFTNNVITIISLFCILITIIGIAFANPIVKLFAIGYEGERLAITVEFTRILLVGTLFITMYHLLVAFLNLKDDFLSSGMSSIPYSTIIIVSIILSLKFNVRILAYGTLLAIISQFLYCLFKAYKRGLRYKFVFNIKDENIKKMIILIMPVLIGVAVSQLNGMIDKSLASTIGVGVVTSFNYANKLYLFVQAIFVMSIVSVIYPTMSNLSSLNDNKKYNNILKKSINIILLLIVPISCGAIVLANPIVSVLFERGAFNSEDVIMTASILRIYSIGMVALALRDILTRAFYSSNDTKTPMKNGIIAIVINIILNLVLIKPLGYKGLALASTISAFVGIYLLFWSLIKINEGLNVKSILIVLIKSVVAAVVMGFGVFLTYEKMYIMTDTRIVSLFISVLCGVLIYVALIFMFKVEETSIVTNFIEKKISNKKIASTNINLESK